MILQETKKMNYSNPTRFSVELRIVTPTRRRIRPRMSRGSQDSGFRASRLDGLEVEGPHLRVKGLGLRVPVRA